MVEESWFSVLNEFLQVDFNQFQKWTYYYVTSDIMVFFRDHEYLYFFESIKTVYYPWVMAI